LNLQIYALKFVILTVGNDPALLDSQDIAEEFTRTDNIEH